MARRSTWRDTLIDQVVGTGAQTILEYIVVGCDPAVKATRGVDSYGNSTSDRMIPVNPMEKVVPIAFVLFTTMANRALSIFRWDWTSNLHNVNVDTPTPF